MSKDNEVDMQRFPQFPNPLPFHSSHGERSTLTRHCFYNIVAYRAPKRGEWYYDGYKNEAFRAGVDFQEWSKLYILVPTHYAERRWFADEPVTIDPEWKP